MGIIRMLLSCLKDEDSLIGEGLGKTRGNETPCGSSAYHNVIERHDDDDQEDPRNWVVEVKGTDNEGDRTPTD